MAHPALALIVFGIFLCAGSFFALVVSHLVGKRDHSFAAFTMAMVGMGAILIGGGIVISSDIFDASISHYDKSSAFFGAFVVVIGAFFVGVPIYRESKKSSHNSAEPTGGPAAR